MPHLPQIPPSTGPTADSTPGETATSRRTALAARCRTLTESRWFATTVFVLILANAVLLGVETYDGVLERWEGWLRLAEHSIVAVFTLEILLRVGAHLDRPSEFFRDRWNLFDLAVVLSVFLPVVRENGTILRLLRLARVMRAARFLPQLRIILVAVGRSLPGTVSFLFVGALVLYFYAMVGWVFFADADPEHYGSLGRAVLTLFLLMTLDGLGDAVHAGLEISRWSFLYYASYVLLGSFVLVNVLIGVVLNSLDEARALEEQAAVEEAMKSKRGAGAHGGVAGTAADLVLLRERITAARSALDEAEAALGATLVKLKSEETGKYEETEKSAAKPINGGRRPSGPRQMDDQMDDQMDKTRS
ncbi:ion transporter [Streptomyces sp. NA04227]|uniref:ion transporter n=1 Tax=Streptomyces sp. NA04227 TaxID=2742136 RepID=UPI0015911837|nr:ion transporter [Streptomyces sp. NA04227]QKW09746.1 ion transporter [Streptomyces sp. NA04227]